jgi:hypothetical protein
VFVVNSRLGLSFATHLCFYRKGIHTNRLPFSRSYGDILPSSLTRVFPRTLGFSPRLPVSVCGTGTHSLTRSFSRQYGVSKFTVIANSSPSLLRLTFAGFTSQTPYRLRREFPSSRLPTLLCHSIAQTILSGTGISTSCPSPTHLRLGLGPDLP